MESAHILLVDDQSNNLETLLDVLKNSGYHLHAAINGMQALRLARSRPLDLMLLDVMMPEIDGFEVCRQMKADPMTAAIPIIFLTALTDTSEKLKGFEVGAVDYITKPFQHAEVLARVRTHILLRQAQQQLQSQNRALHEQNDRFRRLEDATFEGLVIHENGQVLEANQRFADVIGLSREALIGRQLDKFMPFPAEQSPGVPYELDACRPDGRVIPLRVQTKSFPWEGRTVSVSAVQDMSEQKYLAAQKSQLEAENFVLRANLSERTRFGEMVGKSVAMQRVYEQLAKAAASDFTVLITGESGTGKELAARTVHNLSARAAHPFITVNCGSLTASLFESELFGHRKGAFTGADRHRKGYFESAQRGSIFLDEVGELSLEQQVALLRVLQEEEYVPVGESTAKPLEARVIAATNRDLDILRQQGRIRDDFFYRINVLPITLPPLRERKEDIPLLIGHLLEQLGAPDLLLPPDIRAALLAHDWPGNIRELHAELKRYLVLQHLTIRPAAMPQARALAEGSRLNLPQAIEQLEHQFIAEALEQCGGERQRAAEVLGIDRKTLYRKLKQYHLES